MPSNSTASGSSPLLNSKSVGPSLTIFKLVVISLEILISFGRPTILERGEDEYYNTLKESNIFKKQQNYKFEINLNNKSKELIIQSVLNLLHYITLYPKIITKEIQNNVLQKYNNLIKQDIKIMSYNKKNTIPLLTPKPITLEKVNLELVEF